MADPIQDTNTPPQTDLPAATHEAKRPAALTDEEFEDYCRALYWGRPESEVMAEFGIGRREYWRVRAAAARRQNRELWEHAQRCQESTRRHEKWETLYERAMDGSRVIPTRDGGTIQIRKPFRSVRAVSRLFAYQRFDENRTLPEPPPA